MITTVRCSCGLSADVRNKDEVLTPGTPIAKLVAHAHSARHTLSDLCRGDDSPLPLQHVSLPPIERDADGRLSRRPSFRSLRGIVHAPGCPCDIGAHGGGDAPPAAVTIGAELFSEESLPSPEKEIADFEAPVPPRASHFDDFGCWCGQAISRAITTQFGRALSLRQARRPAAEDTLRNISNLLRVGHLANGISVTNHLSGLGWDLAIGITQLELARTADEIPSGRKYWFRTEKAFRWQSTGSAGHEIEFPFGIGARIHGRARAQTGYYRPPYLFIVAGPSVSSDRIRASRVFLHPVALHDPGLGFVESGLERLFETCAAAISLPLLKPQRLFDTNELLRSCRQYRDLNHSPLQLANRPDGIFFGSRRLALIEVAGRNDQEYLDDLAKKMDRYKTLKQRFPVCSLVVEERDLHDSIRLSRWLAQQGVS